MRSAEFTFLLTVTINVFLTTYALPIGRDDQIAFLRRTRVDNIGDVLEGIMRDLKPIASSYRGQKGIIALNRFSHETSSMIDKNLRVCQESEDVCVESGNVDDTLGSIGSILRLSQDTLLAFPGGDDALSDLFEFHTSIDPLMTQLRKVTRIVLGAVDKKKSDLDDLVSRSPRGFVIALEGLDPMLELLERA